MPVIACPRCNTSLRVNDAQAQDVTCPCCRAVFDVAEPAPQVKSRAASPDSDGPRTAKSRAGIYLLLGLMGAAFVLVLGIVATSLLFYAGKITIAGDKTGADATKQATVPSGSNPTMKGPEEKVPGFKQPSPEKAKSESESDFIAKLAGSMSPEEQKQVKKAIDQGMVYLRGRDEASIDRLHDKLYDIGCHVLIGWTLLECGVAAHDRQVQAIAQRVRDAAPRLTHTYALSLSVIFLNKLGEVKDQSLIRTFSLRLIAGQNQWGGWKYNCPILNGDEERLLLDFLLANSPSARIGIIERRNAKAIMTKELPDRLKELPVARPDLSPPFPDRPNGPTGGNPWNDQRFDDNSNTQFAILGIWSALRHGVPVDRTAALVRSRFQVTQNHDHSWSYLYRIKESPIPALYERRDAMTCAGLLGLALGHVAQDWENQSSGKDGTTNLDPRIDNGLKYLGGVVGVEHGKTKFGDLPIGADSLGDLYFLWSLERVGVLYRQKHIGGKEWYPWGARLLVQHQRDDGSWHDRFGPDVNTCFALLYLKCANPVASLTESLESLQVPQRLRLQTAIPSKDPRRSP